eukprot:scaffold129611_cov55-Attheya_sp.AAC.2
MVPKLHAGVGAIAWVMAKFVHPSKPINEQYPNWEKNHKLEGGVLVKEENKVIRRFQQIFFEALCIPT